MGLSIYDERTPQVISVTFNDADGAAVKALTPAVRPCRVDHIYVSQDDIVDHDVRLWTAGSGAVALCTVTVPSNAGYDPAVPGVDLIPLIAGAPDGLTIAPGEYLNVRLMVGLAAGKFLAVYAIGGTF